jgi:hypothetical protein
MASRIRHASTWPSELCGISAERDDSTISSPKMNGGSSTRIFLRCAAEVGRVPVSVNVARPERRSIRPR